MFTLFDLVRMLAMIVAAVLLAALGWKQYGIVGCVLGIPGGWMLGGIIGQLRYLIAIR